MTDLRLRPCHVGRVSPRRPGTKPLAARRIADIHLRGRPRREVARRSRRACDESRRIPKVLQTAYPLA